MNKTYIIALILIFFLACKARETVIKEDNIQISKKLVQKENSFDMNTNRSSELNIIAQKHKVIGMGVCIVKNGVIMHNYYGLRNLKDSLPVTESTLFRVASISKTVTTIAFMQLVEKGGIDLDADINNYLKGKITHKYFPDATITSRMLLSHTSGIFDGEDYGKFLSRTYSAKNIPPISELLTSESKIWVDKKPGTYFTYSNLNFGVLATIIENVAKERFDKYVKKNILDPLGVKGGYNVANIKDKHQISVLYRGTVPQADNYENVYPEETDYPIGVNGLYYSPQGGLRVSADDLTKILQVLFNKGNYNGVKILRSETIEEMEKTQWLSNGANGDTYHNLFLSWGLGLHKTTKAKGGDYIMPGYSFIGHPGDAYGLISDMYYNREKKLGFVFISNGTKSPKGYLPGENSYYFKLEEDIFDFIYQELIKE